MSYSKATPADLRSNTYIDSSKDVNDKNLKFKICDNFSKSKYKIAFAKFTLRICWASFCDQKS